MSSKPSNPVPSTLSAVEALLLSKLWSDDKAAKPIRAAATPTDGDFAQVDVTVRVTGEIRVGEDSDRKATVSLLRKATIALLMHRMGCTREWVAANLPTVLTEILELGTLTPKEQKVAEAAILARFPEIDAAFTQVDEMARELPRIPTKGVVTVRDLRVERVDEAAANDEEQAA